MKTKQPPDAGTVLIACPHCGRRNDQHAPVVAAGDPDRTPRRLGDAPAQASMCFGCGGIAVVERAFVGVTMRVPTVEEWAALDAQPEIVAMVGTWETQMHRTAAR